LHNICSHTKQGSKLYPRDEKHVGIGYAPNKKGYKSYHLQTMKIHVSMDVSSIKNQPYFIKTHPSSDPNNELQVYIRRTHMKDKDLPIIPTQDQPNSSRDGPKNIPGIPTSISVSIVPFNNKPIDFDILIAFRKGVQSCNDHLITKYSSYQKISNNYWAFNSNISQLFIQKKAIGKYLTCQGKRRK